MTNVRCTLLATMQDLMSNYLVDECPDNVAWEGFDPDIDNLRCIVTDLIADGGERVPTAAPLATFTIDIDFFSGEDRYATEVYTISASSPEGAQRRALQLSLGSIYSDPRIPDLSRSAVARPANDPAELS